MFCIANFGRRDGLPARWPATPHVRHRVERLRAPDDGFREGELVLRCDPEEVAVAAVGRPYRAQCRNS